MTAITANDLKIRGVRAIDQALAHAPEATIAVRGKVKYVVVDAEHYHYLRECELEAALAETRKDLDAGNYVEESAAEHVMRLHAKLSQG